MRILFLLVALMALAEDQRQSPGVSVAILVLVVMLAMEFIAVMRK